MAPQSCESPGTKWHLGVGPVAKYIVYYKGEGGGFPQVQVVVSFVSPCLPALFMHQRWSNYALTNLLFGLYKFVWVIDLLVNLPSPHPEAPAHCSTPKVMWTRERTPTPPFVVFIFGLVIESIKELGGVS
jgi:hypothetical protein